MTTGRINQVTIRQRTRTLPLRELHACASFKRMLAFSSFSFSTGWTARPATERTRECRTVRARKPAVFSATSFDHFTLASFRHTAGQQVQGMPKSRLREGKLPSETWLLFLAKGHRIQQPSIQPLPRARQLFATTFHAANRASESLNFALFSSKCHRFVPANPKEKGAYSDSAETLSHDSTFFRILRVSEHDT